MTETRTLQSLIGDVDATCTGDMSVRVSGIAIDSRRVHKGDVFVALRGTAVDGHDFVAQAIAAGAVAVVAQDALPSAGVPVVCVADSSKALAVIAAHFHGDAAHCLSLAGVTGTNGKSSCAFFVHAILNARRPGVAGLIGTLGWGVNELHESAHTTPDASRLHEIFRSLESAGCNEVVMEVSSHAVRQHRTWGLKFGVGILTNITHDHLDYHADWEDYRSAKEEFCLSLVAPGRRQAPGTLVYWREDDAAREIGERFAGNSVSVGRTDAADVFAYDVNADLSGTRMRIKLQTGDIVDIVTRMAGPFVPVNAVLSAAAAVEMGASAAHVQGGLNGLPGVPGRFETLGGGDRPTVIVDYAHTTDAFEQVLMRCRELGACRITTVFGCGGDRDRSKRPLMAAAALRLSDHCIITTDNPRHEPLNQIIGDILAGMGNAPNVTVELERDVAIRQALRRSSPGDVVALLGKGHEPYQLIGNDRFPFSDRAEAEGALKVWRAR